MRVLVGPSIPDALSVLLEALRRREVIVTIGKCIVYYTGRAASVLEEGERIVIIKSDKTVIVHRPKGLRPANFQSSSSMIKVDKDKDRLLISAYRRKPMEVIKIEFSEVKLLCSGRLVDLGELYLYGTEKEMVKAFILHPEIIEEKLVPLKVEKERPEGFIDMLARDKRGKPVILEVKRREVVRNDVLQLYRYVSRYRATNPAVRGIIVAPSISKKAALLIEQLNLEFKAIDPRKCYEILKERDERGKEEIN